MNARIPTQAHTHNGSRETLAIDRRQFLGATGGLTLGLALWTAGTPGNADAAVTQATVNSWLTIGSDESIVLTVGASEMGQGSSSGLAQVLAEDLMVDWTRVQVVQGGPTVAAPAPVGTAIATVGSSVTRGNFWRMRDAGAAAREMLVQAAMNQLGDGSRGNFGVNNGVVTQLSTGVTRTYGQLAATAATLTPPSNPPLVPDGQLKVIGKSLPRKDIPAKVDGSAVYGLDVRLPGMVFAAIKHCPTLGGTLAAAPATPSGALAVIPVAVPPGCGRGANLAGNVNAVAVVAGTTWDAMRISRGLAVSWKLPAAASGWSSAQFLVDAQKLMAAAPAYVAGAANPPGTSYTVEAVGDAATAYNTLATRRLDATYSLPFVSHACMEVLSCTIDYVPGVRCVVYAPSQTANSALKLVAAMTGLPASAIDFRTTMLGGGLGRKAENDFIGQAVQVAMALKKPVQLMWPREEDFTHDQYRPAALVRVRAGLDPAGQVVSWQYRNVSSSILGQRGVALGPMGDSQGYESSQGLPYAFGSRLVEWVSGTAPVPVGFWRSVGASINVFAVESAMDELAKSLGQDPYQFRRNRLGNARWLAVLDSVASLSGWGTSLPAGTARGIAIGSAFNSIVASVVEVTGTSATSFRVTRVSVVLDSTLTVNPQNVEAQIAGGVVHGLNATLYGQQTFSSGAAQRRNFNTNPMLRLSQMPQVRVALMPNPAVLDRTAVIGGVGELGVPTIAPALANAVAKLTGTRVRTLPFFPAATMGEG